MRKKFGLGGGILTLGGVIKKEIAKTAVGRKDQLLELIKKGRAKKLFRKSKGKFKQKTIKLKDDITGKAFKKFKAFKDESLIMDVDTYNKVKNMPDKKVINNLKEFGFKFKDK